MKGKTSKNSVSPFSKAGGGFRFEWQVAVYYLVALLRQEPARGLDISVPQELRLQLDHIESPTDDILIHCKSSASASKIYFQAKHLITFGNNKKFKDVIGKAWQQWSSGNFQKGTDKVGLAVGNKTVNSDVAGPTGILTFAKTSSNGRSFYNKVNKYIGKSRCLNFFENGIALSIGKKPSEDDVHNFLKHFFVIQFDFDPQTGRDTNNIDIKLLASVGSRDTRDARGLAAILFEMVSEYASSAGEIDRNALAGQISANASFSVPILQRAGFCISDILRTKLLNQLDAEKNSKKYIPDVFFEVSELKDMARLFCHPILFLQKILEDARNLDFLYLNKFLSEIQLPLLSASVPDITERFDSVERNAKTIRKSLQQAQKRLRPYLPGNIKRLLRKIPANLKETFYEVKWQVSELARNLMEHEIAPLQKMLDVAVARVLIIVSKAGQGKTNFVCDLAENCLLKRKIPCAYFTGKELAPITRQGLQGFIARAIYGDNPPGKFEDLLNDMNEAARCHNTTAIIIIDAINEHPNPILFVQELREMIEKCGGYTHIRIILTCRSEYFDARFGALLESSFANKIIVQEEIHQQMTIEHRHRMVDAYLRFFKIHVPHIHQSAFDQLGQDPFLLRIFCETHGAPNATCVHTIGNLRNIRRAEMFKKYFKKKLDPLGKQRSGVLLDATHPYQCVLKEIVEWMIKHQQYVDIPLISIDKNNIDILSDLVGEDVLLRRDLNPDSVLGRTEVLNFTFDACRDFLLSDHLLHEVFAKDPSLCKKLIVEITKPEYVVAEGLQQYLFYASRHMQQPSITKFLESLSWFEDIYISSVFDLEEEYITQQDTKRLTLLCIENHQRVPWIIANLLRRYDPMIYKNANILTLFKIFDTMEDEKFSQICLRTFDASNYGTGGRYPIHAVTEDIGKLILSTGKEWHASYKELARLMLYLWMFHMGTCLKPDIRLKTYS